MRHQNRPIIRTIPDLGFARPSHPDVSPLIQTFPRRRSNRIRGRRSVKRTGTVQLAVRGEDFRQGCFIYRYEKQLFIPVGARARYKNDRQPSGATADRILRQRFGYRSTSGASGPAPDIVRRDQQAGVVSAKDLGEDTDIGGEDRQGAGHGFDQCQADRLPDGRKPPLVNAVCARPSQCPTG
jgi:hypothetical protein